MKVLAPIDGSDCSFRALRFAVTFASRFEADLEVVHITDVETEATDQLLERARAILDETGVAEEPSISIDFDLSFRGSNRIGRNILDIVEEDGYDHVVMGHHGSGRVERAILGSATETVLRSDEVPVTIIP